VLLLRTQAAGSPLRPLAAPFVAALAAHPEREEAVIDGLHALTGVSLAPDARLWQDWWRRSAIGPAPSVPSEGEEGPPSKTVRAAPSAPK
jgi:hypothetical protein